jgi:hypothetical protein
MFCDPLVFLPTPGTGNLEKRFRRLRGSKADGKLQKEIQSHSLGKILSESFGDADDGNATGRVGPRYFSAGVMIILR